MTENSFERIKQKSLGILLDMYNERHINFQENNVTDALYLEVIGTLYRETSQAFNSCNDEYPDEIAPAVATLTLLNELLKIRARKEQIASEAFIKIFDDISQEFFMKTMDI